MKVTIVGRQMNVWDEMKTLIEAKLGKLGKYFNDECSALGASSISFGKLGNIGPPSLNGIRFAISGGSSSFHAAMISFQLNGPSVRLPL